MKKLICAATVLLGCGWIAIDQAADQAPDPTAVSADSSADAGFSAQAKALKYGQSFTTAHQHDAGTPDADRWYLAKSTEGGFSIRLPAPYSDTTTVSRADDGVLSRTHTLTSVASDGSRFTAECSEREDSKIVGGPSSLMEKARAGLSQFSSTPISEAGSIGYEFQGATGNGGAVAAEAFIAGKQLCEVIVAFPGSLADKYLDEARKAFASFKPAA